MCACAAQPRSGLAPVMPTRILSPRPLVIAMPAGASGAVVGVGLLGEPHSRPDVGKLAQLFLAELAEELRADAAQMGVLGLAERAATAARDHGLGPARVRRTGFSRDIAL